MAQATAGRSQRSDWQRAAAHVIVAPFGTNSLGGLYPRMIDPLQDVVTPIAIERAMGVYERLKDRDLAGLVQARKALIEHIYGLVCAGETDEQRLIVGGLTHLKSLEPKRSQT
jgi:hypothetical protein